ncbi:MAG TPA: zinc ribbon domain-containing protein [Syntrophales bacterium]|nr:zinc ribbon domain-containing protein [Syntrophales bacterium]
MQYSKCSHTHPENRQTQALFVCQNCGFTENADFNASLVIKKEGNQDVGRRRTIGKTKEACHAVKEKAATRAGTARRNARRDGDKPN